MVILVIENLIFVTVFIILFVFFVFLYGRFRLNQYRKAKKEDNLKWKYITKSSSCTTKTYYAGRLANSDMSIQNITGYLKLTNGVNKESFGK